VASAPALHPDDRHNRQLAANTHPVDRINPEPVGRYNLIALGGGTAGLVSAAGAAILGGRAALVESQFLGGDCLVAGCVPSKALIRAAEAVAGVREAGELGVRVPDGVVVDFPAVMERLRSVRAEISHHDAVARFSDLGVDVFLGRGRFSGRDAIEVEGKTLRFKKAVIATGGRPVAPPIPGLEEAGYLTNETIFDLTELPRRLLIVGGGPIGSELAQAFARLGSEVTVVEMMPQFLPLEDPDAAEILAAALLRDGVRIRLGTRVRSVARTDDGKQVELEGERGTETITVDEILVGVGRLPNVGDLNLEAAGVAYDPRSGVQVNDRLQTTNRHIYAAGDVALPYKFTHTADASARIVLQNALFPGRAKFSSLTVPWTTYTSPEIAHVGLYERDAEARGIPIETFEVGLSDVDRSIIEGRTDGFVKVHVKRGSGRIVGATIVGERAGDWISEITLAMVAGAGLGTLSNVIHPYPTQAEAIRQVADLYRRSRLTPGVRRWLARWLAWTR
jgi:pyruvate/2-oxoglutarate dehydrogenase complex dihydrolipoamide dehydrogenase (E3) component